MATTFKPFESQNLQVHINPNDAHVVERRREFISMEFTTCWDDDFYVIVYDFRGATRAAYNAYVRSSDNEVSQVWSFFEESSLYQGLVDAVNKPAKAVIGYASCTVTICLYDSEELTSSPLPMLSVSRFHGDSYLYGPDGSENTFTYEIEFADAMWQWANKPLTNDVLNTSEVIWFMVTFGDQKVSYIEYDSTKQHGRWIEKTSQIEEIQF
jgi:hypothetical protein